MPTASEVREHILSNSPWVDRENTVDTVKTGDCGKPVRKAGVCWYPDIWTIRKAIKEGCDLLVTHEPLYWDHLGVDPAHKNVEPGITKQKSLDESGLVVLRIHDSWDNWPDIGIRDSWAKGLGLTRLIAEGEHGRLHGIYEIPEQPLKHFAKYLARRIQPLGEDSVQVIGDPDKLVSRPSLGVGCIVPEADMIEKGSDVLIVCHDGAPYWARRERYAELGAAVITVEHGTSEMWGIENLCGYLMEQYPGVDWTYYAEHPRTWTVRGE